ncbi:hypothetical protein LTS15_004774 [Exophiala xenobiotica]|nr:hypothetical protein LTS15_004774 [Exophiala xenobiotica]
MDSIKPKRQPRPPPKLRTKTGCHKCRERRKKCDEKKPICGACSKLNLHCTYTESSRRLSVSTESPPPSPQDLSPASTDILADLPLPSPRCTTVTLRSAALRSERDWQVFQYASARFLPLLTTPDATSEFRDVSFVFAIGFEEPWVMHAALAPAALHASYASLMPKEDAIVYTQSALQGLRQAIQDSRHLAPRQETFLAASLYLGVFEDFYSAPASQSLTHYKAIAQVLEAQTASIPRLDIGQLSVFQRTLLDSVLYHFSTRLIFEEDVNAICKSFPSQTIAMYIEALESGSRESQKTLSILPVLGLAPPSLFLLIYHMTWLSRQLPFDHHSNNYAVALQCSIELDELIKTNPVLRFDDAEVFADDHEAMLSNTGIAAKLYALATKIFILKILHPHRSRTTSPQICTILQQGYQLLKRYDGSAACGQSICWAILILGCTACPVSHGEARGHFHDVIEARLRLDMRRLIQRQLLHLWKTSYSGYVRRTASVLEKIWTLPDFLLNTSTDGDGDPGMAYDGLNALIFKHGLGQALVAQDSC